MTSAFVLSGGGSLGAVQVGQLAALVEKDIRPELIVGTSVGAVNGGWIAARPDAAGVAELERLWVSLSRNDIFPLRPIRGLLGFLGLRNHLVPNSGLRRLLERNLPYANLEDASIPLHVGATDVLSGADVLLSMGDAVDAILASTAIPAVFPPVEFDQRHLMDGGAVNNHPLSHAVTLGADTLWVLSTGYACALPEPPRDALGMALHALTVALNHRLTMDIERYQDSVELRVVPTLCPCRVSPADFRRSRELIDEARVKTREWLAAGMPPPKPHPHLLEPC